MIRKCLAITAALAATAVGSYSIASATTVTRTETSTNQSVEFDGVTPNTQYAVSFYAYHYYGDTTPYVLGYSGLRSNAYGQYKASVSLSDLAQQYDGEEGPVYSVRICLQELPSHNDISCTGYSYVGYYPKSFWYYHG